MPTSRLSKTRIRMWRFWEKCTPDVALTPSGGLAPIYLAEREVESIPVGEKTDLIIMTRGKGDVLIRRD